MPRRPTSQASRRVQHAPCACPHPAKRSAHGSLNGGFISTPSNEPGASPTAAKASDGAVTSSITAAARLSKPLRAIFAAAMSARSGSRSTSVTLTPGTRAASARPAAPTPAPSSTMRSPGFAAAAAASRIASWPTRWPVFFWVSRNLPPSTASSVCSSSSPGGNGRSSWASPASASSRRADCRCSSSTRMRHVNIPSEPSSTLMLRSSTTCGISAPLSSASIAVIRTALLVRTSSCTSTEPSALPPLFGRRALREIGQQLQFTTPARHGVENEA